MTSADHIQPAVLTYQEAAAYLGVSVNTVKRLVGDGSLRHIPLRGGRIVRFRTQDLDGYLESQARGGAPRKSTPDGRRQAAEAAARRLRGEEQ